MPVQEGKKKRPEHDIIKEKEEEGEEEKFHFHLTMTGVMKRKRRIGRTTRHLLLLLYLVMSLVQK